MKKLLIGLLALGIISSSYAQNISCSNEYERIITKRTKAVNIMTFSGAGVGTVATTTAIAANAFYWTAAPISIAFGLTFTAGVVALPAIATAYGITYLAINPNRFSDAYELSQLLDLSYDELKAIFEEKREEAFVIKVKEFENKMTHPTYAKETINKVNEGRLSVGEPVLSEDEVRALIIDRIRTSTLGHSFQLRNNLSEMLDHMKKKGWASSDAKYDDLRLALQNDQEVLFCDNNKPQKIRKIVRRLKNKI
jgi:hypothetical protein